MRISAGGLPPPRRGPPRPGGAFPRPPAGAPRPGGGGRRGGGVVSRRARSRPREGLVVVVQNPPLPIGDALQLGENVGYARAANAGAGGVPGEILLLNDDTRLDVGCLAA